MAKFQEKEILWLKAYWLCGSDGCHPGASGSGACGACNGRGYIQADSRAEADWEVVITYRPLWRDGKIEIGLDWREVDHGA